MADECEFFLPSEVDVITKLSESTRARREKLGCFPRREKISSRKVVYRKTLIREWQADPEGWARRNSVAIGGMTRVERPTVDTDSIKAAPPVKPVKPRALVKPVKHRPPRNSAVTS
jgi:predicted DNA-binding transcriptional regulator AlpA